MSYSELLGSIGDFIDTIPEEFRNDILTETFGPIIDNHERCFFCNRVKHIGKFTLRSHISEGERKVCLACYNKQQQEAFAKYSTYHKRLTVDEAVKEGEDDKLLVKCKLCKKYYNPNRLSVSRRIWALNSDNGSESNLYCSDNCKDQCPLYRNKGAFNTKIKRDAAYTLEARTIALKRAKNKCEICGETENLHVHHIVPVKENPLYMYDIDNLIVLCAEKCHMKYGHKQKHCTTGYLAHCEPDY